MEEYTKYKIKNDVLNAHVINANTNKEGYAILLPDKDIVVTMPKDFFEDIFVPAEESDGI